MKNLRSILLGVLLCALSHPCQLWSQTQPIKYFGYSGPDNDADVTAVSAYTNFSYISGIHDQPISSQVTAIKNKGLKAVIDLGQVLWCPDDPNNLYLTWHLCSDPYLEGTYTDRWNYWVAINSSFTLNSNNVLAFSVMTEQTSRGISVADLQTATALVKQTFPNIPTMVIDSADDIVRLGNTYQLPTNVDWVGMFKYYVHPSSDSNVSSSVNILKSKKQSTQKLVYVMDGFYGSQHSSVAPTIADMDTIAQEWYSVASRDPEAILLGVFLWPDLTSEGALGSISFPQNVRDKHAAIGKSILAAKPAVYQGTIESGTCDLVTGWAWDQNQPNTPVSLDLVDVTYGSPMYVTTIRANTYRPDLVSAGIGNGVHGVSFSIDPNLRYGSPRLFQLRFSGTNSTLSGTITLNNCPHPSASISWIKPSSASWGPANTMTVAGLAKDAVGGVELHWRDATIGGPWTIVQTKAQPNPDGTWWNTIPSANKCHDFVAFVVYYNVVSSTFYYYGNTAGFCP